MREENYIGKPVRSLQTMLRTIAAHNGEVKTVVPDGIYGRDTRASVLSFQRAYGLLQTGTADLETWEAIVEAYETAVLERGPAEPLAVILQPGQVIRRGEDNAQIYMINGVMLAISRYFPSMPRAETGGTYGEELSDAVIWVQKRAGLPQTGDINRATWKYIARLYRTTVGDGTRPQT